MKVKLRDLTLEQYEKWKETNCPAYDCENKLSCHKCVFNGVDCAINLASCYIYHKDMFSDKFLDQEIEIDCESILTEEEREYLSAVIKPFRNKVEHIKKEISYGGECITISTRDNVSSERLYPYNDCTLPIFEKGKYYKGMELFREYTLEELRL